MRHAIDRRTFFAAAGAAGLLLPARPALAAMWPACGFTHSVASGDPAADAVTLWTRYVPKAGDTAPLRIEVAGDAGFGRIVARAEATASAASDYTAQARVTGLAPGGWLFYRFIAPDGSASPTGRTRTLPQGPLARFNIAVFSCANKPFGWFNAYAHAAARSDIDLVVHLGDYLYEYPRGTYPSLEQALAGRDIDPAGEMIALADYRLRYASYRADPALQELHRQFPMISIWDDHEFANDAWKDGAENHQTSEGPWPARVAAALQAHREWLPNAPQRWNRYDIGDLVSLITLDTRLTGRDRQLDLGAALKGGKTALADFANGPWRDPQRTLLGFEQEAWLAQALAGSVKAGQKWQLVGQQVVMGNLLTPKTAMGWLGATATPRAKGYVAAGIAAASAGMPGSMDSWGGYAPARSRLLKAAQSADADMVVISGDSHNAWAFDLADGGKPAGVEFAGHSVTSPGYEAALVADPAVVRAALVDANPEMRWCDTSRRGYLTVAFTPDKARADWVFLQSVRERTLATTTGQTATVARGRRRLALT